MTDSLKTIFTKVAACVVIGTAAHFTNQFLGGQVLDPLSTGFGAAVVYDHSQPFGISSITQIFQKAVMGVSIGVAAHVSNQVGGHILDPISTGFGAAVIHNSAPINTKEAIKSLKHTVKKITPNFK